METDREKYEDKIYCEFCQILTTRNCSFLYEDHNYFAIEDIEKCGAKEHLLLCTKEHIETCLELSELQLKEMQKIGIKLLKKLQLKSHPEIKLGEPFRLGFHLPPNNSIDHVHLHCFLLPFDSFLFDKVVYGKLLTTIPEAIQTVKKAKHQKAKPQKTKQKLPKPKL